LSPPTLVKPFTSHSITAYPALEGMSRKFLLRDARLAEYSGFPSPRASREAELKFTGASGRDHPQDPVAMCSAVPEQTIAVADKKSVPCIEFYWWCSEIFAAYRCGPTEHFAPWI